MRELPKDIINEMKVRFNSNFDSANKILTEYLTNYDYLDSDRIIRCLIFLSKNRIESWKSNLNYAKAYPRDVMYWAEYEGDFKNHKVDRVRDFEKTFSENGI